MSSSIIQKFLTVLDVVSSAQAPLTFSEIVERTGLNKSTIHRLLAIGVEEGMVRHDAQQKTYFLGNRAYDLVRHAYHGYDIQQIALDEMVQLHARYDANVTIGVPSGLEVSYLRILESRRAMGGVQRPGTRDPIHCSASGKALLAYLPDTTLESMLAGYEFKQYTDRTITSLTDFKEALQFVRENGFGTNEREEYDHFHGISSPIFNYLGDVIAVLNMWTVHPHHAFEEILGWSEDLKAASARVTDLIGGVAPKQDVLLT